ncbi:ribonuclease P protein component [Xylanibacter brevis]|uniref:ribonuclease P protein component n=1 Tax=Xylanibacter brevis TaxID=83231 RepID=UPI0004892303
MTASAIFQKRERIVSRKLMDELFGGDHSHAVVAFPLKAVYLVKEHLDEQVSVEVLISVSKKHFKHAVDRNRVKRQVREAYRKQKQLLADRVGDGMMVAVAFIWMSNQHISSAEVDSRVKHILMRIAKKIGNE